ncbi:hypothetical protein [Algoriphagus sp. AK58]|uniref:hypothetical protein n=1 Tax=Algoriphagus sp. AK58 TaxID=1406877 RepID=UPI00164EFA94|nr:hypothetical protein [Algoriphagus sp. AK58]MBC6367508.1 hypothetical protein [Algoriphagus sp. AK58]
MELKSTSRFFFIWAVLGALAMALISLLPWRFQVNDDEVMMWLVSGAYTGTPESFAVFLHPLLSWTFSKFYLLFPSIPWYPLMWFGLLYAGFLAFVRLVEKRANLANTRWIWALFAFSFFCHFLFFLQFTLVSAFAITSGLAWRLSRDNGRNELFSLFPEDFLIFLGFLVRPEVLILFLLGGAIVFGGVFKKILYVKKLLIPAILWGIGGLISWMWIQAMGLGEFQNLNELRSQVFDHPALQLHKEDLRESNPDLYFFSNGLIDFQKAPELAEKLLPWKEQLDQKRIQLLSPQSVWIALTTFILHEHFVIGLMLLFLAFGLFLDWKQIGLLILLLGVLVIAASPFFLIKVQIYAILYLFFFMGVFLIPGSKNLSPLIAKGFFSVLIFFLLFHFYSFIRSKDNKISADQLSIELNQFGQGSQVYLIGKGEYYRDLLFDHPLRFKILGWPTLLEQHLDKEMPLKNLYFVDSATYFNNLKYFDKYQKMDSESSMVLLLQK